MPPKLSDLANFLRSILNQKQISELIIFLQDKSAAGATLDPEQASAKKEKTEEIELPTNLDEILKEIEQEYSSDKFPDPSKDDSRRVRDSYPGLLQNLQAFQIRHLIKMLRERLGL